MRLAKLSEYAATVYTPESRPTAVTLRRMAERGDIPAVRQGRNWFVDMDQVQSSDDPDELLRRILNA